MRGLLTTLILTVPLLAAGTAAAQEARPAPMILSIPGFEDGGEIPVQFSQAAEDAAPGGGTSPEITWENTPEGTQSFVLHMHDIDVARDNTIQDQVHWLVWNIPGTATSLPEGIPEGQQLEDGSFQTSATGAVYRGPGAPASGPLHHYVFELYALDTMLDVDPVEDAFENRTNVLDAMDGHVIGKAAYVGLFRRPE